MGFSLGKALKGAATGGIIGGGAGALTGGLFGVGGGSGGGPNAPDYTAAAQAQGLENRKTALYNAKLNNPNVNGPFGSQSVSFNDDGTSSMNQTLSPELQNIYNQRFGAMGDIGSLANDAAGNLGEYGIGSEFDTSGLPAMQINPGQTAQDAIMSRLQPHIERNRQQRETELANQGIMQGSEAWKNAQTDMGEQENDLYTDAALKGIDIGNRSRQQALDESIRTRELPMNEIMAMLSGSQVDAPNFQGFQGVSAAPTDIMGATQAQSQWDTDMYNANQAKQSNMMNGLFGLGGSLGMAAMLSDRRVKTDIHKIGEMESGLSVYSYKYKLAPTVPMIGVLADEVEKIFPDAVIEGSDGYKRVDYSRLH